MTERKRGPKSRTRPNPRLIDLPVPDVGRNFEDAHPVFCLRYLDPAFDVKSGALSHEQRGHFAERLQEMASLSWKDLMVAPRHKQGFEWLPASTLRSRLPERFADEDRVMVFRYSGKLPMVGVRLNEVFHVLALEARFNDLYDHGN